MKEYMQQLSADSVGRLSVFIGGSGTTIQILTEYASLIVLAGNMLLVIGGLYLMAWKILDRWRKSDDS
tara:strand:+ start:327 stop:530 length:204 start_codon:yes stop_codon:yes gene_type:complete